LSRWRRRGDRGGGGRRRSSNECTCSIPSGFGAAAPGPGGGGLVESVPDEHLHLSAVTLGELQAGVEIAREHDPAKAAEIEAWIGAISDLYNVLPLDGSCFRAWARMMHRKPDDLVVGRADRRDGIGPQSDGGDPQRAGFSAARQSDAQSLALVDVGVEPGRRRKPQRPY
jgi:hypothetical protein